MKDEALKLALEALEGIHPGNMTPMAEEYWNKAITAIKQALAAQPAPVQEWMKPHPKCDAGCLFQCTKGFTQFPECATTPPAAQPAVPDALNPKDENPAYAAGWNDCRAEMLKGMKP
jgi:hypothetical protein